MALNTNTYGYVIDPLFSFCDQGGKTIANGYVRVFHAGTSTPVLTYRNFDGAFNNETIELDNSGRTMTKVIASKGNLYKVCVYDAEHSQEDPILTVDKVAVIGASVNATSIIQGLNDVAGSGWIKSVSADDTANLSLDPTGVTSEVSTIGAAETAAPDYVFPLLDKTGTGEGKKISLANLFKFSLDWISRLATTVTSFASGDFIAVSNTTNGARKMSKDTLLELTAQNALAGNAAPEFVPNDTNAVAGMPYVYGGKLYVAKEVYQGPWDASKFERVDLSRIYVDKHDAKNATKIVHFSFDDVCNSLQDLTDNENVYESIFDQPFFGFLKQVHDEYGAVFSLYVFKTYTGSDSEHYVLGFDLTTVTDKFKVEFSQNADWLKFGSHDVDYEFVVKEIERFAGYSCIDRFVRLSSYYGALPEVIAARDSSVAGLLGLFTLTGRYYLTGDYAYLSDIIASSRLAYDSKNDILFVKDFAPIEAKTLSEIEALLDGTLESSSLHNIVPMYTHEYECYTVNGGLHSTQTKSRLDVIFRWAISNAFGFGYVMDYINPSARQKNKDAENLYLDRKFEYKRNFASSDLVLGAYYKGNVGETAVKSSFSASYAENGYVIIPVTAGERVKIKSKATSSAASNFIVVDSSFVVVYNNGYDSTSNKEFTYDVMSDGCVICNSLPANFSFEGIYKEALFKQRFESFFAKKFVFGGSDLEIGYAYRNDPVTKAQPSTAYRDTGCLSFSVVAGDVLVIKGSPSTTDNVLILTDSSSNRLSSYAKGTLDKLTAVKVASDGYAYINSLPENFECTFVPSQILQSVETVDNEKTYTYNDLNLGQNLTYTGRANVGFTAPSLSASSLNKSMAIDVKAGDELVVTTKAAGSAATLILADSNNIVKKAFVKEMKNSVVKVMHDGKALLSCEINGTFNVVHKKRQGVFNPFELGKPVTLQQLAADGSQGSEFDAADMTSQDIYDALDALSSKYPYILTSKVLGKDASNMVDVKQYVFGLRTFLAWQRDNYPKMYAFVHDSDTVYSPYPSPRVGDSLYSVSYIGTASLTVSSVAVSGWTLSDSNVYIRDASKDVEATIIYTKIGEGTKIWNSSGYYTNSSGTLSDDALSYDGNTYHRNHLYDAKANEDYQYKMCVGCAEHGPLTDPRETAITLYNVVKNLCEDAGNNEFLSYVRNNVMISFIPIINPWGFDNGVSGRQNSNGVNINRNYNTPGWSSEQENPGAYPGSEIETQYAMNLFAARKWDNAFSVHCLGLGQEENVFMFGTRALAPECDLTNSIGYFGFKLSITGGATSENPQTACTSCAYMKYVGIADSVLIELSSGYDNGPNHTSQIMTMDAQLMLLTMWYLMRSKN